MEVPRACPWLSIRLRQNTLSRHGGTAGNFIVLVFSLLFEQDKQIQVREINVEFCGNFCCNRLKCNTFRSSPLFLAQLVEDPATRGDYGLII